MHRSGDSSTDQWCPGEAPWEADLEGEKVVNDSQSQCLVGTVQIVVLEEKESIGKELGSEKETCGK